MTQRREMHNFSEVVLNKLEGVKRRWFCWNCGRWCPNCNGRSCNMCCIHGIEGYHHCTSFGPCHCSDYELGILLNGDARTREPKVSDDVLFAMDESPYLHEDPHDIRYVPKNFIEYKFRPGEAVLHCVHGFAKRTGWPEMTLGATPEPDAPTTAFELISREWPKNKRGNYDYTQEIPAWSEQLTQAYRTYHPQYVVRY